MSREEYDDLPDRTGQVWRLSGNYVIEQVVLVVDRVYHDGEPHHKCLVLHAVTTRALAHLFHAGAVYLTREDSKWENKFTRLS